MTFRNDTCPGWNILAKKKNNNFNFELQQNFIFVDSSLTLKYAKN